jgi:hypothetical protein
MRLLEDQQLHGAVLVAACHTDLGEESEAQAGYYPPSGGDWQWERIKANAGSVQPIYSLVCAGALMSASLVISYDVHGFRREYPTAALRQ